MIRCEHLCKSFGRETVLRDFALSIDEGERVALIGSNGAGKTTLIRCLLGEYRYQGSITVGGFTPRQDRQTLLLRTGFVPQFPPPLKMPVAELIRFAAGVCETDQGRMFAIASQLGLDAGTIKRRSFNKLSGGQKQKLLISIALGRDCDLLILDEPAANLDPEARQKFIQMLDEYGDGVTMLISSHRLDEVSGLVNRVIEMDQGKIVLDDLLSGSNHIASYIEYQISLHHADDGFTAVAREWGLTADITLTHWDGAITTIEQPRFLMLLSRYSGMIESINMVQSEGATMPAPIQISPVA